MTMMVMQASRIGIIAVVTSMILRPFLYVVTVASGAQAAVGGVVGRSIGSGSHFPGFFHFFQELASTFHVERRHILWKSGGLCD